MLIAIDAIRERNCNIAKIFTTKTRIGITKTITTMLSAIMMTTTTSTT